MTWSLTNRVDNGSSVGTFSVVQRSMLPDGRICASLTAAGLAVKLPLALYRAMLKDGRGRPLRYFDGGNVKKGYVVFSEAVAADPSAVRDLFERSFRHVRGE